MVGNILGGSPEGLGVGVVKGFGVGVVNGRDCAESLSDKIYQMFGFLQQQTEAHIPRVMFQIIANSNSNSNSNS